ncbi:(2Fe-2S) ferredoxin domain-containing protein [Dehalococcoidia bacterium]|nr:(2Fe-2S) ferredoxin domain-containing protein [Dehalococcoidia bacterium]
MPEYKAQVFVCTNSEDTEDQRHCGNKSGDAIRQQFNQLLVKHGLLESVSVGDVGCTSQHSRCSQEQGSVTVFGPTADLGGVWYTASPDDVEEIITEHLIGGRLVERLRNPERSITFT